MFFSFKECGANNFHQWLMTTQQGCLTTSLKCLSTASQITAMGFRPLCAPTRDDAQISALRFRGSLIITERHGSGKAGSAPGALAEMYWLKTQHLIAEHSCLTLSKSGGNIYKIRFFKVLDPDWIGANFNASWRQFTSLIAPLPLWHISNPYFTGWAVVKRLRDLKTLDFSFMLARQHFPLTFLSEIIFTGILKTLLHETDM